MLVQLLQMRLGAANSTCHSTKVLYVLAPGGEKSKYDRPGHLHAKVGRQRARRSGIDESMIRNGCPVVLTALEFGRLYPGWAVDTTFYSKVAGNPHAGEIPVLSSAGVSEAALQEAFLLTNRRGVLVKLRPDILADIRAARARVVVLGDGEAMHQIPEYGAASMALSVVLTTEANLLCAAKDPNRGESMLVRGLADTIRLILEERDQSFKRKLFELFTDATDNRELYKDNEQVTSPRTYWSENVKSFFAANVAAYKICSRSTLRIYDQPMEALLAQVFGDASYGHVCPRLDGSRHIPECGSLADNDDLNDGLHTQTTQTTFPGASDKTKPGERVIERTRRMLSLKNLRQPKSAMEDPSATGTECEVGHVRCDSSDPTVYYECSDNAEVARKVPVGTMCSDTDGILSFIPVRSLKPLSRSVAKKYARHSRDDRF